MRAGDLLLFHRPTTLANLKADPWGTFFTALIHLSTRSRWNHAAIAVNDSQYAEATASGVRITNIGTSSDVVWVEPVYFDDEDDREDAVTWAAAREGVRYGYLNAFWCGLRNMIPGAVHIKQGDSIICSELVAEALERAGYDFDKDSALMSPGDLADAFGVQR